MRCRLLTRARTEEKPWRASGLRLAMAIVLLAAVSGDHSPAVVSSPQLIIEESVAADFAALAEETWTQTLSVFRGRTACFGDVRLRASRELAGRASYDPQTATITVKVPGTRSRLQVALVHEIAHHIEFQCTEHQQFRPTFLALMSMPPNTPWRAQSAPWPDTPSERYAEAAVLAVLGDNPLPTKINPTPAEVAAVAAWAAGQ